MRILVSVIATILILILAGLIVMYTGTVNVSVLEPPSKLTRWFLSTNMERSVKTRAHKVEVPDLENEDMIQSGAEHYFAMCEICHSAPGKKETEMAKCLEPKPPHLYEEEEAQEWNASEKFWITKHGIMFTGMPAWGITHSDEDIWNMVAFIQKLPEMDANEYSRGSVGDQSTKAAVTESSVPEQLSQQVVEIFKNNCKSCHSGSDPARELKITKDTYLSATLNQPSIGKPQIMLVEPGKSQSSYLAMKIRGDEKIEGARMPFRQDPLAESKTEIIIEWINQLGPDS